MQTNQQQHEVGGGGVELSPTSNNTSSPQTTTRPTDITIAFKNLSVTERTFADPEPYNNVYQSVANGVLSGGKTFQLGDFHRLRDASGIITPGSMTLVLSSAGGGRTTYLKALSQRLKTTQDAFLVNGEDIAKINADGAFDLKKAVQYADQIDTLQLPLLTVYETLEFAAKLSNKDHSDEAVKNKVEYVISTLGLTESQHTIIGDESTRGISGGQRKRCNIAQTLVTPAKVVCLDTYTDGLDSATSLSITQSLKKWCAETGGAVVATLQGPSMDLFNQFDKIVLLQQGRVVYDGPRTSFEAFLCGMGYDVPRDQDLADFVIEMLSQPEVIVQRQKQEKLTRADPLAKSCADCDDDNNKLISCGQSGLSLTKAPTPCVTLQQMLDYYHSTPFYTQLLADLDAIRPTSTKTAALLEQYPTAFHVSFMVMLTTLLTRQLRFFLRNKPIFFARIINAIIMSLFYGSLYVFVNKDMPTERVGQEQLSLTLLAFANMLELPMSLQFVEISFHQMSAKLYSPAAFILSGFIMSLPVSLLEVSIYSIIVYFMTDHYVAAGQFFLFWVVSLMQSVQLSTWFKMATTITTHPVLAQALAVPATGLFMTLSGVFLFRTSVPYGMIWLYYLSPFSWSVRALMNVEYLSPRYDTLIPLSTGGTVRYGDYLLESVDMFVGNKWIISGVFYLLAFSIMCLCAQVFLVSSWVRPYPESARGTQRTDQPHKELNNNNDDDAALVVDTKQGGVSLPTFQQYVPFTKSWLTFENVKYTVQAQDENGKSYPRVLLQNITGIAEPGTVTYLVGASGSGKTTLLTALSQRANTGVEGEILINGDKLDSQLAADKISVVEQFDTLFDFDTVYESLLFVARLKLSADLADEVKKQIVNEVIGVLDLENYKNSLIWTLSPGQRKTVNIGLALVGPQPLLFLDEPTTSLSSKDALLVMNITRKIASLGKTIIATIHQPSTTVFWLADQILLLSPGGFLQYCGPLGYRSKTLVDYFSKLPSINPIQPQTNPSEWLLGELSRVPKEQQQQDFPKRFLESEIYQNLQRSIQHFSNKQMSLVDANDDDAVKACQIKQQQQQQTSPALPQCTVDNHSFARASTFSQFVVLFRRNAHYLLRNPFYVTARLIMCIGLAVVFGLIYFQSVDNPTKQSNAISAVGASFVPIFFVALLHAATALPAYYELRAVFYRETQNRYFSAFLWTLVNLVNEAIWVILTILITMQPLYFLIGAPAGDTGEIWGKYLLSFFALVMTFISMSFAIASVSPNFIIAQIVLGTYYMLTFSLCGLGIPGPNIPSGYFWLFKMLTLGHVLESVVGVIFEHKDQLINVVMGETAFQMPLNQFIFAYLNIESGHYWMMLLWVLVFNLAALLIAFVGNTFLRFNKS